MPVTPLNILLVEDNEGDVLLTTEALSESSLKGNVFVVKDGWEATQFLGRVGKYDNQPVPELILLDINLPKMNGHEVLAYIRSTSGIKNIPVVILTTSISENDIPVIQDNKLNFYITKPIDSGDFSRIMLSIEEFWIVASQPQNLSAI